MLASMRWIQLLAAVAAVVAVLVAAPVVRAETTVDRYPFSGAGFNPCTEGELVEFTGSQLIVSHNIPQHGLIEIRTDGLQGIAPSTGARYVASSSRATNASFDLDGAPFTFTLHQRTHFVRLGEDEAFPNGDDFDLSWLLHVTVNANGTVTSNVDSEELTCG